MYYFAYGSNMDEGQMLFRCPDSKYINNAVLYGYKLSFTRYSKDRHCGVADIVISKNSEVWGKLYRITEKDLENLDFYEGVQYNSYKKISVTVHNGSDSIKAIAYTVVNKKSFVKPSKEYLESIINAAKKFSLPDEYTKYLISFKNE